jgi:hypothetical protein
MVHYSTPWYTKVVADFIMVEGGNAVGIVPVGKAQATQHKNTT